MAKQRGTFKEGAVNNGVDGDLSMKIFDLVEKFAGYGFNKSHSAAYALVSYQTLWMKTHYPSYFIAAVMSADMDNTEKVVTLVDEVERMGLKILPPDVNKGLFKFNVDEDQTIIYGIGAIKGVGEGPIDAIIAARESGGEFTDLFDFCNRVDLKKINKRIMEKLIYAGALDKLGPHRAALHATLPEAMKAAAQHAVAEAHGQSDLFGILTTEPEEIESKFADVPEWPDKVWLEGERETLGLYLTGHPINQYIKEVKRYSSNRLKDVKPTERGKVVTAVGLVISAQVKVTKKGTRMGILEIDDKSGRLSVMFFSEAFERYEEYIAKDRILVITGEVSFDDFNGGYKMTAREVMDIEAARERYARGLTLQLNADKINDAFMGKFMETLEPYRAGTCPINIFYQRADAKAKMTLGVEWRVSPTDELIYGLELILGSGNVELEFD
jgi:DNA polymerase-3 subunit alpha